MNNKIEKLLEMLTVQPNDCFLHHALALEHKKMGDLDQALSFFHKTLQIDPNYIGSYYHLAKTYELKNDRDNAIKYYQEGIHVANLLNDHHAKNELQMALDDLTE
jgi:Tetratricopeptide repeat.